MFLDRHTGRETIEARCALRSGFAWLPADGGVGTRSLLTSNLSISIYLSIYYILIFYSICTRENYNAATRAVSSLSIYGIFNKISRFDMRGIFLSPLSRGYSPTRTFRPGSQILRFGPTLFRIGKSRHKANYSRARYIVAIHVAPSYTARLIPKLQLVAIAGDYCWH
jgi:hypothetical protein